MTHVEEARKLAEDYADFFCQPECVDAIAAALAAAEERGRIEERERCAPEPACCAREIDELLYRLEPFLKAAAVITERPSEYQPVVARIGGMMNACDLRVTDFQRLATAASAITKEPTP